MTAGLPVYFVILALPLQDNSSDQVRTVYEIFHDNSPVVVHVVTISSESTLGCAWSMSFSGNFSTECSKHPLSR